MNTPTGKHRNGLIPAIWQEGRSFYMQGITAGTREAAVRSVAHYLFYGDVNLSAAGYGQEELRRTRLIDWYERSRPITERALAHIDRCINWKPRKKKPDGLSERAIDRLESTRLTPELFRRANEKRAIAAKARIIAAYNRLKKSIIEPSINQVAKAARAHWLTVKNTLAALRGSSGGITLDAIEPTNPARENKDTPQVTDMVTAACGASSARNDSKVTLEQASPTDSYAVDMGAAVSKSFSWTSTLAAVTKLLERLGMSKKTNTAAADVAKDFRLEITYVSLDDLIPYARNARSHSPEQVREIAGSIKEFGFIDPVIRDEQCGVLAGHGRILAAELLGMDRVPTLEVSHLSEIQKRALILALNRIAINAGWDSKMLALELEDLRLQNFDAKLLGFTDQDLLDYSMQATGLQPLGDGIAGDASAEPSGAGSLAEKFGVPPFSVLNAREGWWQSRKAAWISLGIQSEIGRTGAPGGSPLPLPGYFESGKRGNFAKSDPTSFKGQDSLNEIMGGGFQTGVSIFDPVLCELVYRWFSPLKSTVLDPFAGGSVRGVVAAMLGRAYVGVDLRQEQVDANRQQWDAIGKKNPPAQADADAPDWAAGYPVAELKRICKFFMEHDKPHLFGAFGKLSEKELAEALIAGQVQLWQSGGEIVAAMISRSVGAKSKINDFAGTYVADKLPGDTMVERIVAKPGYEQHLIDALQSITGTCWLEIYQENASDRWIATQAGFDWVCSKIRASSDLLGIYCRGGRKTKQIPAVDHNALSKLAINPLDIDKALAAVENLKPDWQDHYSTYNKRKSWAALALRGYNGDPDFIIKPSEMSKAWKEENADKCTWEVSDTPLRALLPELEPLINAVPGKKERIRLMRLAPKNGELTRHADITDPDAGTGDGKLMRIHIPLKTNKSVVFTQWLLDGSMQKVHMQAGEAWYLDTRKPHTAINSGKDERIHLVMDVYASADLIDMVADGNAPSIPVLISAPDFPGSAEPFALHKAGGIALAENVPDPRWEQGDSRGIKQILPGVEADMIFSCPPYGDLERYSDDDADLSTIANFNEFIDHYRFIIKEACAQLKNDRFACFVVGDYRDKKGMYRNFVSETIGAFKAAGLELYNECILVTAIGSLPIRVAKAFTASRKLGKTHQNVLVFVKGDPVKATKACGAVEFGAIPGSEDEGLEPDADS